MRALLLLAAGALAATCPNTLKTSYPAPLVADGWGYRLVAGGVDKPRSLVFDSAGALLVLSSGVGITRIVLDDHGDTCLTRREQSLILRRPELNHGLQLSPDGKTLYASTANEVLAWAYDAESGSLSSDPRVVVTNMTNSGHTTRTLLLTSAGSLLVSRGSAGNADPLALDKATGHCQIRAFNTSGERQNFASDGETVGWGLRNSVGVAEHPDGGVWSVENSVDNVKRQGIDIHNDNPAEELNFHGKVGSYRGANHGYPACYTLWGTEGVPDLGNLTTGNQFSVGSAEDEVVKTPPSDAQCNADYAGPEVAFQAHTAPLDIKFDKAGTSAFVSFHGSWNRETPIGYKVGLVSFADGKPTAERSSTTAVTDILRNADVTKCPRECFRPVGLAWDSKDRLWVASDTTGEIFVLVKGGGSASSAKPNCRAKRGHRRRMARALAAAPVLAALVT